MRAKVGFKANMTVKKEECKPKTKIKNPNNG